MICFDRGRTANGHRMIPTIGYGAPIENLPKATVTRLHQTPAKAVCGATADLDVVLQLVDRLELLHAEDPDADIVLNVGEACEASFISASATPKVQGSKEAA